VEQPLQGRGRDQIIGYPVEAHGVTTRILEIDGGKDPLVCIHGLGSRADRWSPVMPLLAALGYRVIALDLPGHGLATKGGSFDCSGAGLAAVVAGVMDQLGIEGATVVGTSLGGYIAARLACDRPELVSGLVLVGAVGVAELPDEFQTDPSVVANASEEAIWRKFNLLLAKPSKVPASWVREESMINSSPGAKEGLTGIARYLNEHLNDDLQADRLRQRTFGIPPLLIWGEDDIWTPVSLGTAAQAELPGSSLVLMPECGHAPYFEDPVEFTRIISSHFARSAVE
jgi:2-hydroxy-6-oxonona-2,4-dienedioate hydrolase